MLEQRSEGGIYLWWLLETSLEVPPALGSQTVQLYGWRLCHGNWAENKSRFIFITAVGPLRRFLQRGVTAVPEVCAAWEEAPSNLFVCVPLGNRKRTVWMAVVLWDAYRGLNCHLKSIFPDSVLWIWQLITVSRILMCVTRKNASCRLKSVLCWTCGTEVFHSNSSIYFKYVKGLGGIICWQTDLTTSKVDIQVPIQGKYLNIFPIKVVKR